MTASFEDIIRNIVREEVTNALLTHLGKPVTPTEAPEARNDFAAAVSRAVTEQLDELRLRRMGARFLFLDEAAAHLGMTKRQLERMRHNGVGPASTLWISKVAFKEEDLDRWKEFRANGEARGVPPEIEE